jgi:hypothetical protein
MYSLEEDISKYGVEFTTKAPYWHKPYDNGKVGLKFDEEKNLVLVRPGNLQKTLHNPRHELVPKKYGILKDELFTFEYICSIFSSSADQTDGLIFQIMDRESPKTSSKPVFQILIRDKALYLRYQKWDTAASKWTSNVVHLYLCPFQTDRQYTFDMEARLGRHKTSFFSVMVTDTSTLRILGERQIELKTKCSTEVGQVQFGFYGKAGITVANTIYTMDYYIDSDTESTSESTNPLKPVEVEIKLTSPTISGIFTGVLQYQSKK